MGDVERVIGALTVVESAAEVVVEREVVEPVRRRDAANRGRLLGVDVDDPAGAFAPMRAAS